ncbi:MAG: Rrf2 family transcriptional regulator [Pirellulales bacterium]|nr:Rrf2 family transcriptional regulator [Pirellulales bacterium]
MISQTAEYALRAVVYLASQKDVPRTTAYVAEATKMPAGYLAKVMQSLCRAGLIQSRRGLNGGFLLKNQPGEITLLAIVNAVDPIRRYPECPLGIVSHGRRLCPLHRRLDEAAAMVEAAFQKTTVAELIETPREPKSCRFPIVPPPSK